MTSEKRFEFKPHGDFWSQAPVVLFAAAAVLAILFVNVRSQAVAIAAPAAANSSDGAQSACPDCGVVAAIDGNDASAEVAVAVRMADGSLRTIHHAASGLAVGAQVRVTGDALVAAER